MFFCLLTILFVKNFVYISEKVFFLYSKVKDTSVTSLLYANVIGRTIFFYEIPVSLQYFIENLSYKYFNAFFLFLYSRLNSNNCHWC